MVESPWLKPSSETLGTRTGLPNPEAQFRNLLHQTLKRLTSPLAPESKPETRNWRITGPRLQDVLLLETKTIPKNIFMYHVSSSYIYIYILCHIKLYKNNLYGLYHIIYHITSYLATDFNCTRGLFKLILIDIVLLVLISEII